MSAQKSLQHKMHEEFTRIKVKNPAFSLRAFAKKIKISPAAASEILQGKRRVSAKLAERILTHMSVDPSESKAILHQFAKKRDSDPSTRTVKPEYRELTSDQFHSIAGWHHFAILSLMETKGFRSDVTYIAKRLGIKLTEVETALGRLERLGMIKWNAKRRKFSMNKTQYQTPDEVVDLAVRRSHSEDLELARRSLDEVELELRDFTSITMAINQSKLKEAKMKIRKFRDEICEFLEAGDKTEVYRMCVHLFPMTKKGNQTTEV